MSKLATKQARDAELLRLIRARSEEGLRRVLSEIGADTRLVLKRKFPAASDEQIDEAIADAAMTLWHGTDRYDAQRGSLGGFFYITARNALVSALRAAAAMPLFVDLGCARLVATVDRGTAGRPERIDALLEVLRNGIDELSPMQQDIVLSDLANGDGRVLGPELAARWETSTNGIRVARNRAHKRLRQLLKTWNGQGATEEGR